MIIRQFRGVVDLSELSQLVCTVRPEQGSTRTTLRCQLYIYYTFFVFVNIPDSLKLFVNDEPTYIRLYHSFWQSIENNYIIKSG